MRKPRRCKRCRWKYPEDYLVPAIQTFPVAWVCPICNLEQLNQLFHRQRKRFKGQLDEHYRRLAIQWRKEHPECAPRVKAG